MEEKYIKRQIRKCLYNTNVINSYIDIRHVTSKDPKRLRVICAPQSGRAVM